MLYDSSSNFIGAIFIEGMFNKLTINLSQHTTNDKSTLTNKFISVPSKNREEAVLVTNSVINETLK